MSDNNLKLNLDYTSAYLEGYINITSSTTLTTFPWPLADNSVIEIRLGHILNYIGEDDTTHFNIIKELYRICAPDAQLYINIVSPTHPTYKENPLNCRPLTARSFFDFNKDPKIIQDKIVYLPPAHWLGVDFVMLENIEFVDHVLQMIQGNQITLKARKKSYA